MNNLISLFMDYKVKHLVEYGIFLLDDDSEFLRKILSEYLSVYVDNYYYGIFYTIDDTKYNNENLQLELKGLMEEMLQDYAQFELVESNEEYRFHIQSIRELRELVFEIVKIDSLKIDSKEEITDTVTQFVESNYFFKEKIGKRLSKFIKLVRDTFQTSYKLLKYKDHYFEGKEKKFIDTSDVYYDELGFNINVLHNYRKTMVARVYKEDGLKREKFECLVQKISLTILKNTLENKKISRYIIEFDDSFMKRGKIDEEIYELINNPLFRHYVVLGVSYNTYLNQKDAFLEDFHFACLQDFSHINDVYTKVDNISKDGIFEYLVVMKCKYKDRDFFLKYENEVMKVLVFEED